MAKRQCKMCGGQVELPEGVTTGECPYCGTTTTFPRISGEYREQLYNRAEHFRRLGDFDRAVAAYEKLLSEDDADPEAWWGLVLSKFGIEYVEDPATRERIPTCHRARFESILADADYLEALEHASGYDRELYEREARRIAEIQKRILAVSAQEEPFDVFICYKETTDGGSRTKDSALAQDIYYQLTNAGYRVFFSRITLEEKIGKEYEPYIFAALNSAKVMLVVGTKPEHLNAVWVRNEWSRFLELMKRDRSRLLIPCYRDMDPYDLPPELSMLQSQDMGKIGFVQDLLHGIGKVFAAPELKPASAPTSGGGAGSNSALLKRVALFLETGEFTNAREYCDKLLDSDPENADLYLCKLMAELKVADKTKLFQTTGNLTEFTSYKLAKKFASGELAQFLDEQIRLQTKLMQNRRLKNLLLGEMRDVYMAELDLVTTAVTNSDVPDMEMVRLALKKASPKQVSDWLARAEALNFTVVAKAVNAERERRENQVLAALEQKREELLQEINATTSESGITLTLESGWERWDTALNYAASQQLCRWYLLAQTLELPSVSAAIERKIEKITVETEDTEAILMFAACLSDLSVTSPSALELAESCVNRGTTLARIQFDQPKLVAYRDYLLEILGKVPPHVPDYQLVLELRNQLKQKDDKRRRKAWIVFLISLSIAILCLVLHLRISGDSTFFVLFVITAISACISGASLIRIKRPDQIPFHREVLGMRFKLDQATQELKQATGEMKKYDKTSFIGCAVILIIIFLFVAGSCS